MQSPYPCSFGSLQARTPAPLFSICASEDFWDILFPNVLSSKGLGFGLMTAIDILLRTENSLRGLPTCAGEHVEGSTGYQQLVGQRLDGLDVF